MLNSNVEKEINVESESDIETESNNSLSNVENVSNLAINSNNLAKNKCKTTNICNNNCVKLVLKTLEPSVRKKDHRKQLNGYSCVECEHYYKQRYSGLTEEELKKKITKCSRHRAKCSPYKSPKHFWNTDFPSTPEMIRNHNLRYDEKKSSPIGVKSKKKLKL